MSRHVVGIDDQPEIRDVIRLAIETTTDWSVATFASIDEALPAVSDAPPDVVLLDVRIPGQQLDHAVPMLHRHGVTAPVILLTGAPLQSSEVKAAGAVGLLAKPFDPMTLAGEIAQLAGWQ